MTPSHQAPSELGHGRSSGPAAPVPTVGADARRDVRLGARDHARAAGPDAGAVAGAHARPRAGVYRSTGRVRTRLAGAGLGLAALASLGGCIHVEGDVPQARYTADKASVLLDEGDYLVTIERPAADRKAGGRLIDQLLGDARERGCSTVSVNSYRRLVRIDGRGDDVYGVRLVLSCPTSPGPL
ncbi:hypothetical protein EV659_102291 [Rhodothalassium salexigens DSM 2132]|uniref:Uncharacterized protein n=1 Tax=Rhodothalassium salexigens DSM 2132 TaxID=1188247 RepID=A0A4R2PQ19_RHOSA|nr:hypothetical protein EV659_102291 [Rhodothalassium salexigens DSM 2132]